jgi:hypothetical protein
MSENLNSPRSPYIVGQIIKEPHNFYGREDTLQTILNGYGRAYYVIGIRRIGKSSLLHQLHNRFSLTNKKIPIYLDIQAQENSINMGRILLRNINNELIKHEELPTFNLPPQMINLLEIIQAWIDYCKNLGLETLLLFDEAEEFFCLSQAELRELRNLLLNSFDKLSVVITGSRLIRGLGNVESNFTFNFQEVILKTLRDEECIELINQRKKIKIDDTTLMEILNHSGAHPFYIQHISDLLYENGRIRSFDSMSTHLDLNEPIIRYVDNEFNRLERTEKKIIENLYFNESTNFGSLKKIIRIQEYLLRSQLNELESLSLIRSENDNYFLSNIFWQKYLETKDPNQYP